MRKWLRQFRWKIKRVYFPLSHFAIDNDEFIAPESKAHYFLAWKSELPTRVDRKTIIRRIDMSVTVLIRLRTSALLQPVEELAPSGLSPLGQQALAACDAGLVWNLIFEQVDRSATKFWYRELLQKAEIPTEIYKSIARVTDAELLADPDFKRLKQGYMLAKLRRE